MNERITAPQYFRIALDIARRIAKGELEEGKKIYGRSVMASEYGVSPETIRRALKLLSDVQVVDIRPKSCVLISSAAEAQKYVNRFTDTPSIHALRLALKGLVAEHAALSRKMTETATQIAKIGDNMTSFTPFQSYEAEIPAHAEAVGKNLGELRFWEATGATVIAIRREDSIILSPGPYAQLLAEDTLVYVGDSQAVQAVTELLREPI